MITSGEKIARFLAVGEGGRVMGRIGANHAVAGPTSALRALSVLDFI